ncbi:hypothetical protein [Bacteroides sp. 519]|uniref:hypothetical protein n=1 Tax=Bacteroides sp. 519 TaxID=2302937 RepID=UPI0013D2D3EF|nr:hypothetical protein [Bacteroides sp. 519]NDV58886.1 hypothetical protein [Bacteroides sp. 519]
MKVIGFFLFLGIILSQVFCWYNWYNLPMIKLVREIIYKRKRKEYSIIYIKDNNSKRWERIVIYALTLFIIYLGIVCMTLTKYTFVSQILPGIGGGLSMFLWFSFLTTLYITPSPGCIVFKDKFWVMAVNGEEVYYKSYDWEIIRSIQIQTEDSEKCILTIVTMGIQDYAIADIKGKAEKIKQKIIKYYPVDVEVS